MIMSKAKMKWKSVLSVLLCANVLFNTLFSGWAVAAENAGQEPKKMIYLDSVTTQGGKVFGMLAQNLEKNTKYTISFKCKVTEGKFENAGSDHVYLRVRKDKLRSGTTLYEGHVKPGEAKGFNSYELDADGYTRRYTFTTDAISTDYGINFEFAKAMKMYIADFKVYKATDTEQKNVLPIDGESKVLLTNTDKKRVPGVYGWDADYPTALTVNAEKTKMTYGNASGTFYTAELMEYDEETVFVPALEQKPKMIYLNSVTTQAGKVFGTLAQNLEKNTQYTISFKCKVTEGKFAHEDSDSVYLRVRKGNVRGGVTLCEAHAMAGSDKAFDSYELDTDGYTRKYAFTTDATNVNYGINFEFNKAMKMYIADFKVYKTTDTEQKNVLPIAGDSNVLTANVEKTRTPGAFGWDADWPSLLTFNDRRTKATFGNASGTFYTVELMEYDEKNVFIPQTTPPTPDKPPVQGDDPGEVLPDGPKMIKLDFTKEGINQIFGQNVNLEKGKQYTISFQRKFEEGGMNATTYLQVKAAFGSGKYKTYRSTHLDGAQGFSMSEDEATSAVYYTFTHTEESGQYGIGFQNIKPAKFYIANMSLYETSDSAKTNLLPTKASELSTLKGWRSDYVSAKDVQKFELKTNSGLLYYTATMKPYDAKTFAPKEIAPTMVYIDADKNAKDQIFGQNVKLEKGKNYTISFRYKFKEGDMDSSVFLRVKDALKSGKYRTYQSSNSTGEKGLERKYDKKTCFVKYTFTHINESGTYAIGFQFSGVTKLYLADFKVYETADSRQWNLLPSRGNEDTLLGWGSDWVSAENTTWFQPKRKDGTVLYTVNAKPCDNNIFKPDPELPPKMLYIENNGTYRQLVQRVKAVPGEKYRFSFCVASPIAVEGMVLHKGERVPVFNGLKPINSPDYKKDYYEVVYEFTLPKTFGGEPIDTSNVFVGIQVPAGTIAYVFKPKLWSVNDKEQENLFVNPGFNKGMDNWAFSWGAWFIPGCEGTGVNEFEKEGQFKLQVMAYDEKKFITYYDDSRINDGEWWSADDIVSEKEGTAIVKGRFSTSKGSPIGKAKMVLKSVRGSFECVTDKDGKFGFEKLSAGFYELYYVDNDKNMIRTKFAQNIKDGYTVNVNVSVDGGSVEGNKISLLGFYIAGGIAGVGVAGTVIVLRMRKRKQLVKKAESE